MSKADLPVLPRRGIFAGTLAKPEKKARALALGDAKKAERKARPKMPRETPIKKETVRGELIGVRMPPDMVKRLDKTVKAEGGTRQDTVRRLLDKGLVR